MMPKKIYALLPSEREKECVEHNIIYTGVIPNTGKKLCSLCGTEFEQKAFNKPNETLADMGFSMRPLEEKFHGSFGYSRVYNSDYNYKNIHYNNLESDEE